jgi:phage terminase large subunit-like protein
MTRTDSRLSTGAPRWATPRQHAHPTRGPLDHQVAALLGWTFFPWQDLVADVAGEYHAGTRIPVYRTVGVAVSRQNGKTTLICARIARQLIAARQTVAYTAQDRGLARTKWDEHVTLLMDTPFADRVERIDRTNHREMLVMANGSRYMPVTPTSKKAGRSLSIDLAVLDEAHAHETLGVVSAIQPAMAARPHAQIWLLSNAGDSRSGLWKHYTDVGRMEVDNPASTMAWFEWSPADPDAEDVQFSHAAWVEGNPSLGLPGGVLESALSDGALTMDRPTFLREHLNVWADTSVLTGIDSVVWASCRNDDLVPTEPVAFGLDFTPERDRGSLAVCGSHTTETGETVTPMELIESSSDLERIVARTAAVANEWDGLITIDRGSPAASAVPALERLTWNDETLSHRVRLIPMTELVRACGDFHDAAIQARLAHRGDYRLTDAVVAATKRRVGEAWCWQRRGHADITPLVACTLARWGVVTAPEPLTPAVW